MSSSKENIVPTSKKKETALLNTARQGPVFFLKIERRKNRQFFLVFWNRLWSAVNSRELQDSNKSPDPWSGLSGFLADPFCSVEATINWTVIPVTCWMLPSLTPSSPQQTLVHQPSHVSTTLGQQTKYNFLVDCELQEESRWPTSSVLSAETTT